MPIRHVMLATDFSPAADAAAAVARGLAAEVKARLHIVHVVPPLTDQRCLVCAGDAEELICSACRERIRGEALARKMDVERAGR